MFFFLTRKLGHYLTFILPHSNLWCANPSLCVCLSATQTSPGTQSTCHITYKYTYKSKSNSGHMRLSLWGHRILLSILKNTFIILLESIACMSIHFSLTCKLRLCGYTLLAVLSWILIRKDMTAHGAFLCCLIYFYAQCSFPSSGVLLLFDAALNGCVWDSRLVHQFEDMMQLQEKVCVFVWFLKVKYPCRE